jgi:hypothetical protein
MFHRKIQWLHNIIGFCYSIVEVFDLLGLCSIKGKFDTDVSACQSHLQESRCPTRSSATSHKIKDFKSNGCYNLVTSYKEEVPQDLSQESSNNDQIC